MNTKLSVIIPAYNCEKHIEKTIESLLKQSYKAEIIIVNDGSSDSTKEILDKIAKKNDNIKCFNNKKNLQMSKTRKKGFELSNGEYIVFLDNDDYYIDNDFFSRAIKVMDNNKNINTYIAATNALFKGVLYKTIELGGSGVINNKEYINGFYTKYKKPHSSMSAILRKENLLVNSFDKSIMINDTTIYLCSLLSGDVYLDNTVVATYLFHDNNTSSKSYKTMFILRQLFEKQRLYKEACKKKILDNKKEWKYHQFVPSIQHFADTSASIINSSLLIVFCIFNIHYKKMSIIKYVIYRTYKKYF